MKKINEFHGKLNKQDMSFIKDQDSFNYQNQLVNPEPKKKVLKSMFPHTSSGLLKILQDLLEFNPNFRVTSENCLRNPIFDAMRVPSLELPASRKV